MSTRLAHDFYAQDTIEVARQLLGKRLVHRFADGSRRSGVIVETEAYLGSEDPAAHSYDGRRTNRTEVMFGHAGLSYIYFIYGMYFCFNVVTASVDVAEAVLVRALEPEGEEADFRVASGPGKLCNFLALNRAHNGLDLSRSSILWLEDARGIKEADIVVGPRVGIGDKHDAVHWPLRFAVRDSRALSPAKFT